MTVVVPCLFILAGLSPYCHTIREAIAYSLSNPDYADGYVPFVLSSKSELLVVAIWLTLFSAAFLLPMLTRRWPAKGFFFVLVLALIFYGSIAVM